MNEDFMKSLSLKIESCIHAAKLINQNAWGFIGVGIFMFIITTWIPEINGYLDGALLVLFGAALGLWKGREVAVMLILLSLGGVIFTALNKFGGGAGGTNIVLAIVLLYAAIQSYAATRFLQIHLITDPSCDKHLIPKTNLYSKIFNILFWIGAVMLVAGVYLVFSNTRVDSSGYAKLSNDVFAYYQEQNALEFPYEQQMSKVDLFDLNNFDTPTTINQTLTVINGAIEELDARDEKLAKILMGVKDIVNKSNLSQSAKEGFVTDFQMYIDNPDSRELAKDINSKSREVLAGYSRLYEFMLSHYQDYALPKIGDGTGRRQVVFESQDSETMFNKLSLDLNVSILALRTAQIAFDKYIQEQNKK